MKYVQLYLPFMRPPMWCVNCEHLVDVQSGTAGPLHIVTINGELDWCEGPFTDNQPAERVSLDFFEINGHEPVE
jgi:hypothetical protein